MFKCSYCDTCFSDKHNVNECRDTLIEQTYNIMINLDRDRLKILYNNIVKLKH